jgi:MFS family permease
LLTSDAKRLLQLPQRVFYGWWIVSISATADALKHGTFNRSFTLYVQPMSKELGVGIGVFSLAEMLGRMEGGLQGPLLGWLNDKFGPRLIIVLGGTTSGLGFILLSMTDSYLYFLLVFVGLMSLGFRAGYNNALMPAINQWFRRHRALAMAVASMGSPLGAIIFAPLVGYLIVDVGWRPAAFASGVVVLVVVVPLALFVHRSPESRGVLPDGEKPARETPALPRVSPSEARYSFRPAPGEPDFTAREAMKTPTYWLLVLAVGMRNTVHSGTQWLLSPIIVWFLMNGHRSAEESIIISGWMIALLSACSLLMNPIVGWLGDSMSKQRLSSLAMIGGAFSLVVLLNQSGALWQVCLFVVLVAVSETANPLAWAIMGDFFGRRSYATLRGWQHLPDQLLSMSTPVWMGFIYDGTGSYYWALVPLAGIYGVAAVSYWVIPRPKPPQRVLAMEGA